jgi:hypothetical protein
MLPFWESVFRDLDVDARYAVALRNPLTVARDTEAFDGHTDPVLVEFPVAVLIVVDGDGVGACFWDDNGKSLRSPASLGSVGVCQSLLLGL